MWECWLGKTKKVAVNSTLELLLWLVKRPFTKGQIQMEKDIPIGSVGGVKLTLAGGKAVVEVSASEKALNDAVQVQANASASVDAAVLVDMLFAEIEAKSPPGSVAIEEAVKLIVKNAVLAIK